jgi:hypothetical protein
VVIGVVLESGRFRFSAESGPSVAAAAALKDVVRGFVIIPVLSFRQKPYLFAKVDIFVDGLKRQQVDGDLVMKSLVEVTTCQRNISNSNRSKPAGDQILILEFRKNPSFQRLNTHCVAFYGRLQIL